MQELEETAYWLELLVEAEIISPRRMADLLKETSELLAILVSCVKKVKQTEMDNKRSKSRRV